jgi:DNA ligase D-like protein (predicted 3'-phosphoesterase)
MNIFEGVVTGNYTASFDDMRDFIREYDQASDDQKRGIQHHIRNRQRFYGGAWNSALNRKEPMNADAFSPVWEKFIKGTRDVVNLVETLKHYYDTGGDISESTADFSHVYNAYDYLMDDNNYDPEVIKYASKIMGKPIRWDEMKNKMKEIKERVDEFMKLLPPPEGQEPPKPGEPPKPPKPDEPPEDVKASDLTQYKEKRKFDVTSEPAGNRLDGTDKTFVIQEHKADKAGLHYDFRLSDHGVLKSWAVRKLPDALQGKLVLAKEVEDHPLEYAAFEGEIPAGQYGAGTVKIWDKGTYETLSRDDKKWHIRLSGEQLNGPFVLINTGSNNWLLRRVTER